MFAEAGTDNGLLLAAITSSTTILVALIGAGVLRRKGFFRSMEAIERSVNHISANEPPLIEQVRIIRKSSDETRAVLIEQTSWVVDGMTAMAHQLGVKLPAPPRAIYIDHENHALREENRRPT